ncbi:hypothetical protein SAMN04488103_110152 [Gemmobacter aquatilis]|uniref:Uncharacterized protein n=1 Tax=Gemmobacter aquatilis TaxID=933059 RepID=A0A1H8L9C3_9RHOB|nr:hypothetical protein [Gemmobacter aquatilis]SEO01717.1 hypothetical protein SAMN04488103_110152 [Gemmobacter aquatilis]
MHERNTTTTFNERKKAEVNMNTMNTPETATMTATEAFHNALDGYHYTGGTDYNATRRFYEDAHWVLNVGATMPELAHSDMANVLNSAEFRTWTREGCTYASAARLIRAKLAPVVNVEAA